MIVDHSKLKINYKHFSEVKVNVNDLYFKVLSIQGGKSVILVCVHTSTSYIIINYIPLYQLTA